MTELRCAPIDHWDGPYSTARRADPFNAPNTRILSDLRRELEHLDARDAVIGVDLLPSQIRIDGWPKANAAAPAPVVLTFTSDRVGKPLRFQCDRFDTWLGNLRAIGLTLWRLRLVDESGVATSGEQYTGWAALGTGDPTPLGTGTMSIGEAARLLADHSLETIDHLLAAPEIVGRAYRYASKTNHPDAGGDPELFRRLTDARDVLQGAGR